MTDFELDVTLLNEILRYAEMIPWYGYLAFVVVMMILFGDRKLKELEVTFPFVEGLGSGEIELDIFKRSKKLDIELNLEPQYRDKDLDIIINGQSVYKVDAVYTRDGRYRKFMKYRHSVPDEGASVLVKCGAEVIMQGTLKND